MIYRIVWSRICQGLKSIFRTYQSSSTDRPAEFFHKNFSSITNECITYDVLDVHGRDIPTSTRYMIEAIPVKLYYIIVIGFWWYWKSIRLLVASTDIYCVKGTAKTSPAATNGLPKYQKWQQMLHFFILNGVKEFFNLHYYKITGTYFGTLR